ncbi:energy-coupling factor ABC transporter permease [Marinobacteraceae bacterium S3BR75-40.1]
MGIDHDLLSPVLFGAGWVIWLAGLAFAAIRVDWAQLAVEKPLQHCFYGGAVVLWALWQLRAGISPGLSVHVLGMTTLTLMLGWQLAVLAGALVLIGSVVTGQEAIVSLGVNGVVSVLIPVGISHGIMVWERSRNFRNFFAYIFFCSFFGAGLAIGAAGFSMALVLVMDGAYSWSTVVHDYLRYLPLIMLPEAFLNGVVVTNLMVFHPQRLLTLDESRYL